VRPSRAAGVIPAQLDLVEHVTFPFAFDRTTRALVPGESRVGPRPDDDRPRARSTGDRAAGRRGSAGPAAGKSRGGVDLHLAGDGHAGGGGGHAGGRQAQVEAAAAELERGRRQRGQRP
jgi:hypothetical protein